ncbi:hypothetical protein [Amycolatopsis sp. NPDC059021]|uniref:hypothetical protein n=1 Tax=Amycolatopsis sp. NPDC059021 TaxID=3346704 RepID=UPI0036727AE0
MTAHFTPSDPDGRLIRERRRAALEQITPTLNTLATDGWSWRSVPTRTTAPVKMDGTRTGGRYRDTMSIDLTVDPPRATTRRHAAERPHDDPLHTVAGPVEHVALLLISWTTRGGAAAWQRN